MVRSFTEFAPIARYDGHPWYHARIEEADAEDGPWTVIDTIDLAANGAGLDTDPTQPTVRSLTTENATDALGLWYRIVFVDGSGDEEQPTDPVQVPIDLPYRPSVVNVAGELRERTFYQGEIQGTFTASTRPTADQVEEAIDGACIDIYAVIGSAPVAAVRTVARRVVTLRAAMTIERSYFPSQLDARRSPYVEIKADYETQLQRLHDLRLTLGPDGEPGTSDDDSAAGMPAFSFSTTPGGMRAPGSESPCDWRGGWSW